MMQWEKRFSETDDEYFAYCLALALEMAVIMQCQMGKDMANVVVLPAIKETFDKLGFKAPKNPRKALQGALECLKNKRTEAGPGKHGIVAHYQLDKDVFLLITGHELMPPAFWHAYGIPYEPGWEQML